MINKHEPLDYYEKELMQAIENDELVELSDQDAEIKRLTNYITGALRKDKRITIHVNPQDLWALLH